MKTLLSTLTVFLLTAGVTLAQTDRNTARIAVADAKQAPTLSFQDDSRGLECDTLRYPLNGQIIYYYLSSPESGYITGNNSYKDKAKAEYFTTYEPGASISGIIAEFVIAKNVSNLPVTFAIWAGDGSNGKPGTMIASATKAMSSIVSDVANEQPTVVLFDQPVNIPGPFYAGVLLPTTIGDTLALWCREHASTYTGTAWEQWDNNNWYPFNDEVSWGAGMQTSMTIHPITCKTVGLEEYADAAVAVHPIPSTGIVNITTWAGKDKISLVIHTMSGQQVYSRSLPGNITNFNLDLGTLPKGVYMLRLSDGTRSHNQKLILN
ncbi:MAG: T9SS type A sorting domain-containing protein [Bacteroidales bacterium]|nr:T9SS type A sorting domain-containing protein [Bacteroidales bacterium]